MENQIEEVWKDINNYTNYQVSNRGRVRNRSRGNKLIMGVPDNDYCVVTLCKNNTRKKVLVHRLVAQEFIPNPNNKPCVNHKDGNKQNNVVENLEWTSHRENTLHAIKIGLIVFKQGMKNANTKITEEDIRNIRIKREEGWEVREIAKSHNLSDNHVRSILKGRIHSEIK